MRKQLFLTIVFAMVLVPFLGAQETPAPVEPPKPVEPIAEPPKVAPAEPVKPAAAPEALKLPDWVSRLTISGVAFIDWTYEMEDTANDYNEFDLDRVYLIFWWKLTEKARVRYTMEGGDVRERYGATGATQREFDVVTKHLYLILDDVLYPSHFIQFGLIDLPWVPYEEKIWGYRFQGTVFPDRSGYLTSTDMGVGTGGDIPDGYGSWQASFVNGEGWRQSETGKHKDAHFRLTINPVAGAGGRGKYFFLAGFASAGTYEGVTGAKARNRFIAQVGYKEADKLTLVAEILWAKDPATLMAARHPSLAARAGEISNAQGISLFGVLNASLLVDSDIAKKLEIIGRWDHLDPDRVISDNSLDRYIAGFNVTWSKYVKTLAFYEAVEPHTGTLQKDESRFGVTAEIKF